jgi:hypothetical protein
VPAWCASRLVQGSAVDGEVDLESAGPVPEAPKGTGYPARQPITEDVGDCGRRQIEHRHIGRWQLRRCFDPHARLDLAAEIAEHAGQGIGDRLRAPRGDRPAEAVPGGDDAETYR